MVEWKLANDSGVVFTVTDTGPGQIVGAEHSDDALTDLYFAGYNSRLGDRVIDIPPGGVVEVSVPQGQGASLRVTTAIAVTLAAFILREIGSLLVGVPVAAVQIFEVLQTCGFSLLTNGAAAPLTLACTEQLAPAALSVAKASKGVAKVVWVVGLALLIADAALTVSDLIVASLSTLGVRLASTAPKQQPPGPVIGSKQNVLIYGDNDAGAGEGGDGTGMDNISAQLTAEGDHVTEQATPGLPADLSAYGQIWHFGVEEPSDADVTTLETFISSGGSVFLTGEWGTGWDNPEDQTILDATADQNLTVNGDDEDGGTDLAVNPTAIDGITQTPAAVTSFTGQHVGGLSGVAAINTVVTNQVGDPMAAAWTLPGGGRVVVVMDVNWAESSILDPDTMPQFTTNIGAFLAG